MGTPVRLQRYLATAGVAARRKAEELIVAGRVKVNGKVVTVLGTKIDPDQDSVLVDGEAVVALDHFYVLFNKPKGCITAVTDDRGRPTVMDYLPNLPVPVKPVGRLDFYTEGVLLLTNDGELAARLLAPGNHVPKTYHVKVHGKLERQHIEALRDGITLDDGTTTMPAEIEILPGESKHTWLGITIHEGKHRQIHRMIEALGYQVDKLQRVAFANLTFHELRIGDARELTQLELNALRDAVGLDHSAVARGRWRTKREETDIPRRARAKARAEEEAEAAALGHDLGRPAGEWDADDAGDADSGEPASSRGDQLDRDDADLGDDDLGDDDLGDDDLGAGDARAGGRPGDRGSARGARSGGYGDRAGGAGGARSSGGPGDRTGARGGRSGGYGDRAGGAGRARSGGGPGDRTGTRGSRSGGYGDRAGGAGRARSGGGPGGGSGARGGFPTSAISRPRDTRGGRGRDGAGRDGAGRGRDGAGRDGAGRGRDGAGRGETAAGRSTGPTRGRGIDRPAGMSRSQARELAGSDKRTTRGNRGPRDDDRTGGRRAGGFGPTRPRSMAGSGARRGEDRDTDRDPDRRAARGKGQGRGFGARAPQRGRKK